MIELSFQYKPIFSLVFEHDYFQDKDLRNYSIVPTMDTVKSLDKLKFLYKRTDKGIDILADNEIPEQIYMKLQNILEDEVTFSFFLYINEPSLKNYTNIPYNTNGKIFYLSNTALADKEEGLLHKGDYIGDADLVDLNRVSFDGNEEVKLIEKKNSGSPAEYELSIQEPSKIASLPQGCYTVMSGKKAIGEFLNYQSGIKGTPIGFIDIHFNEKIIKKLSDGLTDGDITTFEYKTRFMPRSVIWRYSVVPNYSKKITGLNIVGQQLPTKSLKFKLQKGTKKKDDDKEIAVFESTEPIQFQEFYDFNFQLKRGESGGKTLIKKLPFAPIDFIKPMEKDQYYSDIYVYI